MKLLLKNTFKKIWKSIGRFLSIMFIITLGISVFLGLRESTSGMLYTADNYYDENNLMDFKIISTLGLTSGDVKALENLDNIDKVIPSYSLDVISIGESVRIHALENDVNNVSLIKGRMPISNNECVADYYKYNIGDEITFKKKSISDFISISKCKVVGTVKSALYVRDEKGISNIGNGKLISFVFVNKEVFVSEYYTEIYIIGEHTKRAKSYYDDYSEKISMIQTELEKLKPIRETIRYEEILKKANDEIMKVKKELNNKIDEATEKLESSKKKLDESKEKLEDSKNNTIKKFNSNYKKLNDSKNLIINNLSDLGINVSDLSNYISNLKSNIDNLKIELSSLDLESDEYKNLSNQIKALEGNYKNLIEMQESLREINNNLKTLDDNYALFQEQISTSEKEINSGYGSYYNGLEELKKEENKANDKINEAKEELKTIEKPTWYLLDRSDNSGYANYKEEVIKVEAIAKVFPIFFIIVAVLMILNTLTRLIEEERTEIGILQSNGFSKSGIIFSYLVYVFLAGIIGIMSGLTIGYTLFPRVIYGVFLSRYYVPKLITVVSPLPFSLVITITLLIMAVVTIVACEKELKEVPATLLRPKAPKSGKKIIFENSKFLWSKLNFMWKATIRNLFRYKKRIVMTIIGVAGCTALLLAGLGINDSIKNIAKMQYSEIVKYDSMFILDKEVKTLSKDLLSVFNENGIVNPLLINENAYTFSYQNKIGDVYLVVPSDIIAFNNYLNLKSTISDKQVSIKDNGAIITQQMAEYLNVTAGDMISIRNSDKELYMLYVSDVVENYVSHYIYISSDYYKEVFEEGVSYNSIIADGKINGKVSLTDYNILMVNYTSDILNTFSGFISGLNKIIIMVVICACLLALVVLYNLTIINVSERTREIATFKVLGFNDKEISTYVYRETVILTFIGIILGLFLGIYFHKFIISTAETDNIMFLKTIKWLSFVLSAVITIVFSFIVQLIIERTLRKIDMIDSLKSAE